VDSELIDLTPDMSKTWGTVLRTLRESGESALHAACAELNDIEFTATGIYITCHDAAIYNLLKKHQQKLNTAASYDCIYIGKPKTKAADTGTALRLKEIFGEKITIK
jgi:hypothetical protein